MVVYAAAAAVQSFILTQVSISVESKEGWRKLTPVVNGSGDYRYLWSSAEYGIGTDRSSKVALIPLDKEDITY